ncbi:MAG TPA: hypothetical protein VGI26_07965 [Solirubrobacteraceae bacterium]|jgi:DNA-directed RNA polymerase specialized sigma24 family protein
MLLALNRGRLRREELEDCYSQATLEMLTRARRGGSFASQDHIANALEQRFLSRVRDRHRAQNGRSQIETALAHASPLLAFGSSEQTLPDPQADVERTVTARYELRRIAELSHRLTPDQRLVLASRLSDIPRAEFCQRHGWSVEKYRKVTQRARARLLKLLHEDLSPAETESLTSTDTQPYRQWAEKKSATPVPFSARGRNRQQGHTYDFLSPPT